MPKKKDSDIKKSQEWRQARADGKKHVLEEALSFSVCPKCGQKYIASDLHVCS